MENMDIRAGIYSQGVRVWEVAHKLHVDASTLSRWLRVELTGERRERVLQALQACVEERQQPTAEGGGAVG